MFMSRCNPVIRTEVNIETTNFHNNINKIFRNITGLISYSYNVSNDEYWINTDTVSFSLKLCRLYNEKTEIIINTYVGKNQKHIYNKLNYIM